MYGTEHTRGYMERRMRLETKEQRALESGDYDGFIKARFALLGYSYDDESDSGGGSALASITAAAASLGSAYVLSQNQPSRVQVPQTTVPTYGAAASPLAGSSSSMLLLVGVAFVGVIFLLFAMD
jgi:hypothetical protein